MPVSLDKTARPTVSLAKGSAYKSTAADRAVDYARAADSFAAAARHLREALALTAHHGARISYGTAVAESIDEWTHEARVQMDVSLNRARRQHRTGDPA